MTWHVAYTYVNEDGQILDGEEFIYTDSADSALKHFNMISEAYKENYKWKKVFVWGVRLMYKLGKDVVEEG